MFIYDLPIENNQRTGETFTYSIDLDGTDYIITCEYNSRIDTWMFTIQNTVSQVTIGPIPLLLGNIELTSMYSYWQQILPLGEIRMYDEQALYGASGRGVDATLETFGDSKILQYLSVIDP